MEQNSDKMKGTFCAAPYISLYVGTQGEFTPCCVYSYENKYSTFKGDDSILEHMNSPAAVQLRKELNSNIKSKGCSHCWELEGRGQLSLRHNFNNNFDYEEIVKKTNENNYFLPDLTLRYIDIRFSNKCNLKCVSCGSDWSTSWYNDSVALGRTSSSTSALKAVKNTEDLLTQLYDQMDNIRQIYFAGGEPLMLPEHYKLLVEIIKRKKADKIALLYSTNLAKLKYGAYDVVPLWKQFKEITIQASIDGSHERGEYLRTNLKWSQLEQNIELLQKECPHIDFNIAPTVSWMNSYNVVDLHREWVEKGYLKVGNIHKNILHSPVQFTLWKLPQNHIDALTVKYNNHIEWIKNLDANEREKNIAVAAFQKTLGYIQKGSNFIQDNVRDKVYSKYQSEIDKLRKVDFFKIFPEFADLKDEVINNSIL